MRVAQNRKQALFRGRCSDLEGKAAITRYAKGHMLFAAAYDRKKKRPIAQKRTMKETRTYVLTGNGVKTSLKRNECSL